VRLIRLDEGERLIGVEPVEAENGDDAEDTGDPHDVGASEAAGGRIEPPTLN
jgi:hypothetical protein